MRGRSGRALVLFCTRSSGCVELAAFAVGDGGSGGYGGQVADGIGPVPHGAHIDALHEATR